MGLFSSSKKTSTQNTTNNLKDDDIITNLSGDVDTGEGSSNQISGVDRSTVFVTSTDHGTVGKAFDFASTSFDKTVDFGLEALALVDDSTDDVIATVQNSAASAIQAVSDNNRTETDKLFEQASKFGLYALGAVTIIIAVMAWQQNR